MKRDSRENARTDLVQELDRLNRLRKQQRELMDKADRVNNETRRLTEELRQTKADRNLQ